MLLRKTVPVDYKTMSNKGMAPPPNSHKEIVTEDEHVDVSAPPQPSDVEQASASIVIPPLPDKVAELNSLKQTLADLEIEREIARVRQQIESFKQPQPNQSSSQTTDQPSMPPMVSHSTRQPGTPQETTQPLHNMGTLFSPTSASNATLGRIDLNPQVFLYTPNTARPTKYKCILDYIPRAARGFEEDEEWDLVGNLRISTGKKHKLDNVTAAQWMAGSSCILAEMITESTDPAQLTRDYMAYSTKIAVLASHYTWKSVIRWDDEYREKQHLYQFRWGSDSAHMLMVHLVPCEPDV